MNPIDRPDASLSVPRAPRYRSLDLWRGLACVAVVIFHSSLYGQAELARGGVRGVGALLLSGINWFWLGVPLFFVISGYCISATADATRWRRDAAFTFFLRRARRIYPPYWVALALGVLLVAAVETWFWPGLFADQEFSIPSPARLSAWQWLGNLTLTESWRWHVIGEPIQYMLGNAWSMCYEEQFYLVMGAIVFLAPRRLFLAAGLITLASVVVPVGLHAAGQNVDGFFFDGRWLPFAAGILVYYVKNYATRAEEWLAVGGLLLAVLGTLVDPFHHLGSIASIEQYALISSLFAIVLLGLSRVDGRVVESRWARPWLFCGKISYSLYLIHWSITKAISHACDAWGLRGSMATLLVVIPICLVSSLIAAWGFHLAVERRFLNRPLATPSAKPRPVLRPMSRERERPVRLAPAA